MERSLEVSLHHMRDGFLKDIRAVPPSGRLVRDLYAPLSPKQSELLTRAAVMDVPRYVDVAIILG